MLLNRQMIIAESCKLISCDAGVLISEYKRGKTNYYTYVDNIPRYINRNTKCLRILVMPSFD